MALTSAAALIRDEIKKMAFRETSLTVEQFLQFAHNAVDEAVGVVASSIAKRPCHNSIARIITALRAGN